MFQINQFILKKPIPIPTSNTNFYSLPLKPNNIDNEQPKIFLKMQNVFIQTKTKPNRLYKSQNTRFRVDLTPQINPDLQEHLLNHDSETPGEFDSPEYREFLSLLPYEIMVKSKQKISVKLAEKTKAKNVCPKVLSYLKKYHKSSHSSKNKNMDLKMKNIAAKNINPKQLKTIGSNTGKNEFQRSVAGNWFKEELAGSEEDVQEPIFSKTAPEQDTFKKPESTKSIQRINSGKSRKHILQLNRKFKQTKQKLQTEKPRPTDYEKKVNFNQSHIRTVSDDESEEEYLCNDDMGIINKFVQNSHNYQKEISYLISSSQLEDTYRQSKKPKIKTCKSEASNSLFSQTIINEIMRKMFMGSSSGKMLILSSQESSKQLSKVGSGSISPSVRNSHEISQIKTETDMNFPERENAVTSIASMSGPTKIILPTQKTETQIAQKEQDQKQEFIQKSLLTKSNKGNSLTNHSESKPLSFKYSTSHSGPHSKVCERRTYTEMSCEQKDTQSLNRGSTMIKQNRPLTAGYACAEKLQCKSLLFNQWIETEESKGICCKENINFSSGTPQFDFCTRNISNGDNKIWVKTRKGKIVKKTINPTKNQPRSIHLSKKPLRNS